MAISLLPVFSLEADTVTYTLISGFEGLKLRAYIPVKGDKPTIGYGATGPDIHLGLVWTKEQAWARLQADVNRMAVALRSLLLTPTSQPQFDALVSLAYNVGAQALYGSQLIEYHNAHAWAHAADAFLQWDHFGGVENAGLLARRQKERALYLSGTPA